MSKWILCKDELPPCNRFVLGYFPNKPWSWTTKDGEDIDPKYVVVIRRQGISKLERDALPDTDKRKIEFHGCDEDGNNQVPYNWETFGSSTFFGQDCEAWMEIPTYENAKTYKEKEVERIAKYRLSPYEQILKEHCEKLNKKIQQSFVKEEYNDR